MTIIYLKDKINRCLKDGLDPDAPVVIIPGNASVSAEKGYCPNGSGYYAPTHNQRAAFYLSVDDPRFEPAPKWDSKPDEVEPELRRCAHCGGEAVMGRLPEGAARVNCRKCDVSIPWKSSKKAAIAAWNRRSEPVLVEAGI